VMKGLYLGDSNGAHFELPTEAVTTMISIIGRRGSGKTTTALVIAEEAIEHGLPVVLLDPLGVHHGLRSSADGESAGLPVVVLGGSHGQLPLEESAGKVIADLVVDRPGAYVIDLSSFESRSAERRFSMDFAERLYRAKTQRREALLLIVDEADTFAPQNVPKGEERMLGAFEAIARRGRVRGLGMTLITQRPAVLNKNLLSQTELMIAHQITAPQDRDALKAWAQGNATAEQVAEFMGSLASLKVGEAWLWSPAWLQIFERIQIRRRRTFDSSATPKPGEARIEPRVLADVDLEELRVQMAEAIQRVEADDPKKLHARIAALERELRDRPVANCGHEDLIRDLEGRLESQAGQIGTMRLRIADAIAGFRNLETIFEVYPIEPAPAAAAAAVTHPATAARRQEAKASEGESPRISQRGSAGAGPETLSRPRQAILDAIAAFEPLGLTSISRSVAAAYAGVSPTSGSYSQNLAALRAASLIEYGTGGNVALTPEGRRAAAPGSHITNVRDLHDAWARILPAPRKRLLGLLTYVYPEGLTREELARRANVSPTSGSYSQNLAGLRSLGLIEYGSGGLVVATKLLYPEGVPV
jgi:hypothetical protein